MNTIYEKPVVEIVEFDLKENIANTISGSTSDLITCYLSDGVYN